MKHTPALRLIYREDQKGAPVLMRVDASEFATERSAVRAAERFMKKNDIPMLWVDYGPKGNVRLARLTGEPMNVDYFAKILFERGSVFAPPSEPANEKGVTPLQARGWWKEVPMEENVALRTAAYDAGRLARSIKGKVSFTFNNVALVVDQKDAPKRTLDRYKKKIAPKA